MVTRGLVREESVHESHDGKSRIKQFLRAKGAPTTTTSRASTRSRQQVSVRPILIAGFPGTGLVGSMSANFIIEREDMHQIAFVDSEFIIPCVTYIGDRLRHPFRIYTDERGVIYVIVCEAPLMPEGIHNIMDIVASWAINNGISEVITLDGMAISGWPLKSRESFVLTSRHDVNASNGSGDIGGNEGNDNDEDHKKNAKTSAHLQQLKRTTLMTGMSAGLLSACLSRDIPCTAVVIPTTSGVPDPEGAALLLQTISAMPNVPLDLDTSPLIQEGREIKRRLGETIASLRNEEGNRGRTSSYRRSMMYG